MATKNQPTQTYEPVDCHKIVRKPMDLEADGDHETKDVPTYTMDQLKILFE
jgi:hypothetical protein